jgi:asparagine synthase (glutamine-hydrolysing)
MIMACFPESAPAPVCYTFVGLTGETIDARLGRQVARVRGAEHHLIHLTTEFLSAYGAHVDRTVYATDGCSGALGAHEMFFNARARDLAPVRLTGNFGSEVLRSMSTFKALHLAKDTIDPELCALMQSTESEWSGQTCHPVSFAAFREIPWKLWGAYAASRSQVIFRSPFLDNEIVRLAYRAPATSRASVRASHGLIAGANPRLGAIPTDRGLVWGERGPRKVLRLARSTLGFKLDYWYAEGLPSALVPVEPALRRVGRLGGLGLHKYLPYRAWFRSNLAGYVEQVVADIQVRKTPFWNAMALQQLVKEHVAGRKNYLPEIDSILTLEAVERLLIRADAHDGTIPNSGPWPVLEATVAGA